MGIAVTTLRSPSTEGAPGPLATPDKIENWLRVHHESAARNGGRILGSHTFSCEVEVPDEQHGRVLKEQDRTFIVVEFPDSDPNFDVIQAAHHADLLGEI